MAEDWSPEEVAAIVADYFVMLGHDLRGEPYNKKEHNRHLQSILRGRSAGAIEFKHANISAVLLELGFPYIDGYKPRANYQELLKEEVSARLSGDIRVAQSAASIVQAAVDNVPEIRSLNDILVPPPVTKKDRGYEKRQSSFRPQKGINYLEIEARNASLGLAGEEFVLEVEQRRLFDAGLPELAKRVEHVSRTRGDGLGYDIASFASSGRERLIEVKTTNFGAMTPFFASSREVAVSRERAADFGLYRVFKFRELPRVFVLDGSLGESCVLDPLIYRASLA